MIQDVELFVDDLKQEFVKKGYLRYNGRLVAMPAHLLDCILMKLGEVMQVNEAVKFGLDDKLADLKILLYEIKKERNELQKSNVDRREESEPEAEDSGR